MEKIKKNNESFEIILDKFVYVGRKKIQININTTNKINFRTRNNMKINFEEEVIKKLPNVKYDKINIEFTLYRNGYTQKGEKTEKIVDKSNIHSIANKFFLDALVKKGIIKDDNDFYVKTEIMHPTVFLKKGSKVSEEKIKFKITNIKNGEEK